MKLKKRYPRHLLFIVVILAPILYGQMTNVKKKTSIYSSPNTKSTLGELNPGVKIVKLGKDKSGNFIKASIDFYIPTNVLENAQIAKGVGESQDIDLTTIKLLSAKREGNQVKFSVEIINNGEKNLDMSALLLFSVTDQGENPGRLELLQCKNSVGTIKPGKNMRSDLIYSFDDIPEYIELSFKSRLGGDRVFYLLSF